MKYRMLTREELSFFEEDLITFLIVNGIHAEEWERINREEQAKAIALIEIFSDTVLQRVYQNMKYLEFRSPDSCLVFHLLPDQVELVSIQRIDGSKADLSTAETIHKAFLEDSRDLRFFKTSKSYTREREPEIHEMIEQDCIPSTKEFWDMVNEAIS